MLSIKIESLKKEKKTYSCVQLLKKILLINSYSSVLTRWCDDLSTTVAKPKIFDWGPAFSGDSNQVNNATSTMPLRQVQLKKIYFRMKHHKTFSFLSCLFLVPASKGFEPGSLFWYYLSTTTTMSHPLQLYFNDRTRKRQCLLVYLEFIGFKPTCVDC